MACLYCHFKKDTDEPFYVGIGRKTKRAYALNHHSRTKFHKNIVAKHGARVEIIKDEISWDLAKFWEIKWIKAFRDAGYKLVNLTDGGDGTAGLPAHNRKKVLCLETGELFDSAASAAFRFGISSVTVSDVCRLKYRSAKDYHFVLSDCEVEKSDREAMIKDIENECALRRKRVVLNKNHADPIDGMDAKGRSMAGPIKKSRPVYSITDDISFPSASSAARYYNVSKSAVIELCLKKNNRKSVGGVRFKYIEGA